MSPGQEPGLIRSMAIGYLSPECFVESSISVVGDLPAEPWVVGATACRHKGNPRCFDLYDLVKGPLFGAGRSLEQGLH